MGTSVKVQKKRFAVKTGPKREVRYTLYLKKNHRINEFEHWPASIKTTIEWFPFLEIMEYTGIT